MSNAMCPPNGLTHALRVAVRASLAQARAAGTPCRGRRSYAARVPRRVVISYARVDQAYVDRLARDISDAGFEVWYDRRLLRVVVPRVHPRDDGQLPGTGALRPGV